MTDGGRLAFDASVLGGAIDTNKTAVEDVIRGDGTTTHGVFGQIATTVDGFTDPINGAIHGRTEGLNANVKRINQQISTAEVRIDAYRLRITKQYSNLELLVNNLKTQGDSLLQALSNLPAIRTK
jgi:flagellar capping protein FliD